jgi:hypothetical protein
MSDISPQTCTHSHPASLSAGNTQDFARRDEYPDLELFPKRLSVALDRADSNENVAHPVRADAPRRRHHNRMMIGLKLCAFDALLLRFVDRKQDSVEHRAPGGGR